MHMELKSANVPLVAIVDDDVSVRRSTTRLLRLAGFRAEAFASAEAFLASDRMADTACLLLDLKLTGMNGLQLQRRLAEASNPVPIIFFSAYSTAEDERQALQAGAVQVLRKPVSKEALLVALGRALKISRDDKKEF